MDQNLLEANALNLVKYSDFNPKIMTYNVFKYVNNYDTISKQKLAGKESNLDHIHNIEDQKTIYIGDASGIYFHWDDWVDLYPANSILNNYRGFDDCQCDQSIKKFASVNGYWMESYNKKVLRGMANVFCIKDIPSKVFLKDDHKFTEIPVVGKKRFGNLIDTTFSHSEMLELLHEYDKQEDKSLKSTLKSTLKPTKEVPFKTHPLKHANKSIDLSHEDFYFDPDYEIFKLDKLNQLNELSGAEEKYLEFLKYANNLVDHSDRYFKYPWIYTDVIQGNSHHLAYPFFKRFIGIRERQSIIQHLIRNWFEFAEAINMPSWVNYGSLLGWSYNGVNMPWDTDVDIQLSIRHLDYLAQHYNGSLILENPKFGNAKYLLDISPTYIKQGNGRNFIDGRFIDINSGLYIDISALSHSSFKPPADLDLDEANESNLVHCKHFNWHSLDEILPIRHTYFEGSSIYIPNNITSILTRKYGRASYTTKSHFMNYNYQSDINLWVDDEICSRPPYVDNRFENDDKSRLSYEGACKSDFLQDEYQINYRFGVRHKVYNQDLDNPLDYNIEELGDFPLTRKDAWDYYNDINNHVVDHASWYHEYYP